MNTLLILCTLFVVNTLSEDVKSTFENNGIVPDVIPVAPETLAEIVYPNGANVTLGNELTPSLVKEIPTVIWEADSNAYYTLAFIDPDTPSRINPSTKEYRHWMVVNIPGINVCDGKTLSFYIGSGPSNGTGLHRYVFLVYKQPTKLNFRSLEPSYQYPKTRFNYSIADFAKEYNYGNPVAGNFYLAQYDDYVPTLLELLGFS